MKRPPKVRTDGKCARPGCNKKRKLDTKAVQIPDLDIMLRRDPFCSALCARIYYGVILSKKESPEMAKGRGRPTDEQRLRMYGRGPTRKAA